MKEAKIHTNQKREVIDITQEAKEVLPHEGEGSITVFVRHTTAAIGVADLDPGGTDLDYLDALDQMIPKHGDGHGVKYRHPHDPSHMPDHIMATLIGPSVSVPYKDGGLMLGTWQRIVLLEFDGPRERSVVIV